VVLYDRLRCDQERNCERGRSVQAISRGWFRLGKAVASPGESVSVQYCSSLRFIERTRRSVNSFVCNRLHSIWAFYFWIVNDIPMTGSVIRFWRSNRRLFGCLPPAMRTGEHANQSCRACRKAGTGGVRSVRAS
jgi:hypothetical protein